MRWTALAGVAVAGMAAAQSIAPDEMHARTFPYEPPPLTLRSDVTMVEVPVVVRDGDRRAVAGLKRYDFELYDAGKKQTITTFSEQDYIPRVGSGAMAADPATKGQPVPRFLAICFDDLHTAAPDLKAAKDAAIRFIRTSLAPGDRVVVVPASLSKSAEFTGEVPKLVAEIEKISTHIRQDFSFCPRLQPYEAYLIANNLDAALLRAKVEECSFCKHSPCPEDEVIGHAREMWQYALMNTTSSLQVIDSLVDGMAKLQGERIVLLASAEFFTGNLEPEIDRLMTKAARSSVVINTLDARRMSVSYSRSADKMAAATGDGMVALAAGTVGTYFHNNNDLAEGFRLLGMMPGSMYMLGFTPAEGSADGRFHNLKVNLVPDRGYSVQAKLGYKAPSAGSVTTATATSRFEGELMAQDTISELPVTFTWEPSAGGVVVVMHLDVSRMHFLNWQNRRAQRMTIVATVRDSQGGFVAGKRSEFELNLTPATFAKLAKTSFTASLRLEAPAGHYLARAVAVDGLDRKLSAAGAAIQVK